MEAADALAASECRNGVREFIFHLRGAAGCEIVPTSQDLLDRSLDLYHQHADKQWTLTDCVSFAIMREREATGALTGDRHFEQAGFAALLK
jgi:predicted nucleic acid-binding protein